MLAGDLHIGVHVLKKLEDNTRNQGSHLFGSSSSINLQREMNSMKIGSDWPVGSKIREKDCCLKPFS